MPIKGSRSWRLKGLAGPNRVQLRDLLHPRSFTRSAVQTRGSSHHHRPCARAMSHVRQTWLASAARRVASRDLTMCPPNAHLRRALASSPVEEVSASRIDHRHLRLRDRLWHRHLAGEHLLGHQARSKVWPEPTVDSPPLHCCARAPPQRPGMGSGGDMGWVGHAGASRACDGRALAFTYDSR